MTILQESNKKDAINFVRLLSRTENMAKEKRGSFDWRLEKFVLTLTECLNQLKKMNSNQPRHGDLIDYTKRVDLLKGLLHSDRLPSTSLKSLAVNQLAPSKKYSDETSILKPSSSSPLGKPSSSSSSPFSKVIRRFGKNSLSQQLFVETKTRLDGDMRKELLGLDGDVFNGILTQKHMDKEADIEGVIRDHEKVQDKLAGEMMMLARSLKENASLAGRIVRGDNEKLVQSTAKTDENLTNLKTESERLEQHFKNAFSLWVWVMLLVVVITFMWMVAFMRLNPK